MYGCMNLMLYMVVKNDIANLMLYMDEFDTIYGCHVMYFNLGLLRYAI